MNHLGGSMFYGFGAFLLIYLVGISIYELYLFVKRILDKRKDQYEEDPQ